MRGTALDAIRDFLEAVSSNPDRQMAIFTKGSAHYVSSQNPNMASSFDRRMSAKSDRVSKEPPNKSDRSAGACLSTCLMRRRVL